MDDLADKLAGLLDSPESLDKIKSLAGMFLAGDNEKTESSSSSSPSTDLLGGLDPSMLLKITGLLGKMNVKNDPRVNLLMALKPYMSEKRLESMDSAMKVLKFSQLAFIIKDEFDIF